MGLVGSRLIQLIDRDRGHACADAQVNGRSAAQTKCMHALHASIDAQSFIATHQREVRVLEGADGGVAQLLGPHLGLFG